MSYETYMDLEMPIWEMIEYNIRSAEQWRAVESFGKTKYILHP